MQSSDQQPAEETGPGNEIEQSSLPLDEFPADNSQLQDATLSSQLTCEYHEDDKRQRSLEESIQQGLIYPPPPSYYQNMQTSLTHPP